MKFSKLRRVLRKKVGNISNRSVKGQIEITLSILVGHKFNYIGRAANMLDVGFGDDVEYISSVNPEKRMVSRFALHVHSSWRILKDGAICLGQSDFFNHMSGFKTCEENNDAIYDELNKTLKETMIKVTRIEATEIGDLKIHMEEDYCLELFVDVCGNRESWRFFEMNNENAHFVIFDEDEEA